MHYDLIIVGGGLVGAGLAAALQFSGWQIALIDARTPTNDDPRLFALNSSSCHFLKNLGLWPTLSTYAAPIHQVHVSYQGHFGAVRLKREEVDLTELGYVIPAHRIEAALNTLLSSLTSFTLYRPAKLKELQQHSTEAQLTLSTKDGDQVLHAPIIIGADGTESTVRAQLGIETNIFDYQQSAIVTRTRLKRSHQSIAYERFNTNGAIAMLPLLDDECATIWTADNEHVALLMNLSDEDFLKCLQDAFGYRLGSLQGIKQRFVFPLKKVTADKMLNQCVFLLGNAAHTLHPIAAQGLNLALYEVALLIEGIKEKIADKQNFTAKDLCQISERALKVQAMSIGISHRLSQAFSHHSFFSNCVLQLGMIGLDVITPIKRNFINRMMGKVRKVPRLLLDTKKYEESISG